MTIAIKTLQIDSLPVRVYETQADLAREVARTAHDHLTDVLAQKGSEAVILATGNSQIKFLEQLISLGGIDWSKITLFHMDEYLGIDANHTASFRRYMRERVEARVKPRVFKITRQCLEVLAEFRNPAGIVTKNFGVTRDIDVLQELARYNAAAVFVSITTLDTSLAQKMEPRTSLPQLRLAAVEKLHAAGIPVGIMCAPVIPGLNDHEMPAILDAAAKVGAQYAAYVPVRLPFAVKDLFEKWIEHHFPDRKDKVLGRIRSMRGGKLNDPNFGSRMNGEGPFADQMASLFAVAARKVGLADRRLDLSVDAFRVPASTISQTQKMFPFCT